MGGVAGAQFGRMITRGTSTNRVMVVIIAIALVAGGIGTVIHFWPEGEVEPLTGNATATPTATAIATPAPVGPTATPVPEIEVEPGRVESIPLGTQRYQKSTISIEAVRDINVTVPLPVITVGEIVSQSTIKYDSVTEIGMTERIVIFRYPDNVTVKLPVPEIAIETA